MSNTTFARLTFLIVAVPLSVYLPPTLEQVAAMYGHATPGVIAEVHFVPVLPPPNQLANLGLGITVSWAVDATCCLVVMCLFYILGEWQWQRIQRQRKNKPSIETSES
jgi:hypothetical protein